MKIVQVEDRQSERLWDNYVGPQTMTVTDLAAWRHVVGEAYGLRSFYLAATENNHFVGGLSLFEVKHPLFGHYLTTAAFSNDGGLYFDNDTVRDALLVEARALADRLSVEYLAIRSRGPALENFDADDHYQTAVIDLKGGPEAVWKNVLFSKTRNQVRRGMKEGFTLASGPEQIGPFYEVFHQCMRDLGSPAHSMKFYEAILKNLGDSCEFVVVRDGRDLAAGALLFWTNRIAMNLHTVAVKKYNRRCPNYLIYWKMIEASCARGCTKFDMGRSVLNSPQLSFKKNWGPTLTPLIYNYYLRKLKEIPYIDPRNPRYRLPIAIWRRLPLAITKILGPQLIKGLL